MSIIGFSEGFHDAAICKIENENILHASHAERYSKVKNDKWLHKEQLSTVGLKGLSKKHTIAYHEKTWLKNTRRLYTLRSWKNDKIMIYLFIIINLMLQLDTILHHLMIVIL